MSRSSSCAAGVALLGVPHLAAAFAGAVLLGAGYGPITPASSEILARTTPPERYAMVFSIKQTGVPVGGVVAGLAVPSLLTAAGPAWALSQIAALCLAGAASGRMAARLARPPRDPCGADAAARVASSRRRASSPPIRCSSGYAACSFVFSAVQVCVTSYTVTFLTHDLRWTLVAAGSALAVAQVAGVVGRIALGRRRRSQRRRAPILLAARRAMALCGVGAAAGSRRAAHRPR